MTPATSVVFSVACGAALGAALAALAGVWLVRGTTAVPAAWWAVGACLAGAAELGWLAGGGADPGTAAAVRLAVLAVSLCPIMAILGAKRPQHGVWQFIVASLGCVLALPALSAALVRPGLPPDVQGLQRGFMFVLLLVGWLNFVATRHGPAASLVSLGQALWGRAFLPLVPAGWHQSAAIDAGAVILIAAGVVVAAVQSAVRQQPAGGGRPRRSHDRLRGLREDEPQVAAGIRGRIEPAFLALRETLGAAWTLRIAERFNTVAAARGWPWRLRFAGLHGPAFDSDEAAAHDAQRTLSALLRRFVTTEWLRRHGWP
jgi:hypothetical protein